MSKRMTPHYGNYGQNWMIGTVACLIVAGTVVTLLLGTWIGFALLGVFLTVSGVCLLLTYLVSLSRLDQRRAFDVSKLLPFRGTESALDLGCGLGKLTVGLARVLPHGLVTGIDIWETAELPGNSPERAMRNAVAEGVGDRVRFESGDITSLQYDDESFDIFAGANVFNNLRGDEMKLKALREAIRVLRAGGHLMLIEVLREPTGLLYATPLYYWMLKTRSQWEELITRAGFSHIVFNRLGDMGCFVATKGASLQDVAEST
ncbi:MAG: methyltransferase domain-containing protein [Candidatus Thorarchaeota archaeon]|nr:methyltransferase domain-containing protein [Candidatus Thorarchaeota archaeon]